MKREKSKIKRTIAFCMAFLLAVSMITPWSGAQPVEAASKKTGKTSKINKVSDVFSVKRVPEDMANLPDSAYDNAGSTPFLLVEQNELYFLNTRSNGSTVADIFDTSRLSEYTTDLKKSTGAVLDTSINRANANKYSQLSSDGDFGNLDYAHGVAFDPTGSGRKDHVAVVGVKNTAKDRFIGVLVIQNTKNGKTWTKDLDNCNWMKNLAYWQAANYLSITAGDYDHNGKDSVVVYCGGDDVFNVYEFEFDGNELKKPDVAVDIKANLLSRRAGFSATGDTALNLQPNVKPVVSLTTGDFDADGIDELAYMCGFMKFSGPDGVNKKNYQNLTSNYGLEPYSAHVNVLEYNNDRWTSGTAMYLYTRGDKCTSKDDPKMHTSLR